MILTTWHIVVALLVAKVFHEIYRVWTSQLSKIPNAGVGAGYSRFAWAFPHEYRGSITIDLPKLHEKLGPLIRIAPNEVSYYSRDTYETVHKVGSGFRKDPRVYGEFVQGGHPALFSLTDPAEHSKRRRIMGQLFSRSKVTQLEDLMSRYTEKFISGLKQSGAVIDLVPACRALEADIISVFSFGTSIKAMEHWSNGIELEMVSRNDEKATWMPVLITFPLLCDILEHSESRIYSLTGHGISYFRGLVDFQKWCDRAWKIALSEDFDTDSPKASLPNLINTLTLAGLPSETALSEARENLGPGTDTTSATLAHILWGLAHNEGYQEALYKDLEDVDFAADMKALEGIPRLQACVKEGIRWAGAAAAMLPRIVPQGGVELHGTFIPEGTVLTSSPIWYLHDKDVFPNPHAYNPYRWLTADGDHLSEDRLRDRYYIPFSRGANICMGAHFAYLELFIAVSQMIRTFRFKPQEIPSNPRTIRTKCTNEDWKPVMLPQRKEWVAAVAVEKLQVTLQPRV